jgi:hypothetical protein
MRLARFAPVAIILAAALSGCTTFTTTNQNLPLIPVVHPPVADVPIPAGFQMAPKSSSKEVNSLRFVDHYYTGEDDLQPVVKFYRDEMPKLKWEKKEQTQPNGKEVSIQFTKANETCVVTVKQLTFSTEIHVRIDPAGRNGG